MCARLCRDIAQTHAVICVVVPSHYQNGHIENLLFAACTGKVKRTGTVSRKALCRQLLDQRKGAGSCVVFIDDAHHLPPGALIAVYSLLTLQKESRSVVRIVMTGETTGLQKRLSLPPFSTPEKQSVPCILLEPLTSGETIFYIEDRLKRQEEKGTNPSPFHPRPWGFSWLTEEDFLEELMLLCDQGLSSAFLCDNARVHPKDVSQSPPLKSTRPTRSAFSSSTSSTKLYSTVHHDNRRHYFSF